MSFPRYPKYKINRADWLREVPEHWQVLPAKWHIRSVAGGTEIKGQCADQPDDGLYPGFSASGQDVWLPSFDFQIPGVVLSAVGARCGKTFKADGSWGVVANTHCLFPTETSDRDFIWYLTNVENWWDVGGTAQPFVKVASTLSRKWCFPPLHEQVLIARFLDRETAKIDALVAEQRRLIQLLNEKRQALISHTVTRGLDANRPMKPSGLTWLGDVPEHWTCLQLGKVCRLVADGPHFSPIYVDEGIPFLSARNVRVDCWALEDVKFISESDCQNFDRRVIPEVGDVLYTKGGTTGIARVVDIKERFQVWVHIAVLKIRSEIVAPHFLAFALNSVGCYEQSQLLTRGATNNDLGLTRMVKIWFALPPIEEQQQIIKMLARQTAKLDALIAEAQHAIDLLQERRTALISAAVTGKIDVRGLVETEAA